MSPPSTCPEASVPLYHAVDPLPPVDIADGLHNVRPGAFRAHMEWLRDRYRLVTVDELAAARSPRGLAAVTFDDGYKSVAEHAFPILADLEIPFTIFINGASLTGRPFWRDKVRWIIHHGLVDAWEAFTTRTRRIAGEDFYHYTKNPANDSATVERELDAFLASRGISVPSLPYCLDSRDDFIRHPLVSYGNHSHRHYVLASLGPREQAAEIEATQKVLESIRGIARSNVFSIPFGAREDIDEHTLGIVSDLGFDAALMSRNRLNPRLRREAGLALIERFMPDERPMAEVLEILRAFGLRQRGESAE